MAAAPEALRGRALGLLSMAIGALPVGMYVLGESAERFGVTNALLANAGIGALVLLAWNLRRPEVVAMTGGAVDDEAESAGRGRPGGPADGPPNRLAV